MHGLANKVVAKILVIPAIFGFALACCHPISAQASVHSEEYPQIQEQVFSHGQQPVIEEGHACTHADRGQTALQAPTESLSLASAYQTVIGFSISSDQYLTVDSQFLVLPRITGPPWDGKSIKAFLGVYRS